MVVKGKIQNSWKILFEYGDIEKIVISTITPEDKNGISRNTISNAIRTGRCSEKTFEAIQAFFKEKKKNHEQFVKENTIEVD